MIIKIMTDKVLMILLEAIPLFKRFDDSRVKGMFQPFYI